jgi:hypothetical protein
VKPLMMHCRASHTVDMACIVQNLPLVLYPSGRKTAHRGTPARCQSAPGKTRLQTMMPSGKNLRRATTARQTHLLPQTKPPCGDAAFTAQLSVGADADWFSHGSDVSAGPGFNTSWQSFWRATMGEATEGLGAKLSAGLNFSFSFSSSVLPPGMYLNSGNGTYWEAQGDFLLGGGLRVETSADGSSISVDLKPSVGFAAYIGRGTTTDNTIASHPTSCRAPGPAPGAYKN